MEAMKDMDDNQFDLAIIDPPYGIGWTWKNPGRLAISNYKKKSWNDKIPPPEYFEMVIRVSKNQIIWGGNYFTDYLPAVRGWIVWKKFTEKSVYSDVELGWTSFDRVAKLYEFRWNGMLQQNMRKDCKEHRIHPTQKPVQLYKWLLQDYAKPGDAILDTHLGSGSIAIACWDLKHDLTAYEIDKEYYDGAINRLGKHKAQGQLF